MPLTYRFKHTSVSFFQKANFLFYLLGSTLMFLLTKYCIGNYYEAYEFMQPAMYSGAMTDGVPSSFFSPIGMVGLGQAFKFLYSVSPHLPWYDSFLSIVIIVSAAVIFYSIHVLLQSIAHRWVEIVANIILCFLFITDFIINWSYTRVAFLACISAFIWWAVNQRANRPMPVIRILCFVPVMFGLGTLIRPEVGELMLILVICYQICIHGFKKATIIQILVFLIPVLLIAGGIAYDKKATPEFYNQFIPSMEFQLASGNTIGIDKMRTPIDSMKYIALREGIVSDPDYINIEFVRRIIKKEQFLSYDEVRISHALSVIRRNVVPYAHIVVLDFFLVLTGFYLLRKAKRKVMGYVSFIIIFSALVFFIAYFITMENRIFAPLLFFLAIASLIPILQNSNGLPTLQSKLARFIAALFLLVVSASQIGYLKSRHDRYESDLYDNHKIYNTLKTQAAHQFLIPDALGFMVCFFNNFRPFEKPDFSSFRNVFLIDMETFSLKPDYKKFLDKNCECRSVDMGRFYEYLYKNKSEVLFVGSIDRMKLFEAYLKIVHEQNYHFHVVSTLPGGASAETKALCMYQFD